MTSGIGRPALLAAILLIAILETTWPSANVAVALSGAIALVLSGCVIPLLPWHQVGVLADVLRPRVAAAARLAGRPPAASERHPAVPRPRTLVPQPHRRTTDRRTAGAALALAEPVTAPAPNPAAAPTAEWAFPAPPRFGSRGSTASRLPWLLPKFTAPAAIQADQAQVGGLSVRAASVVGPGHRCEEPAHPRQDAYRLGRDTTGRFLIVAVADGLSSGARSELGADVAVRHAVDALRTRLHEDPAVDRLDADAVFRAAATAMTSTASEAGLVPADVCAVLVTAVVDSFPDAHGDHPMWVGWIGDASVWALRDHAWVQIAGDAKAHATDPSAGLASNAVNACLPQHPGRAGQEEFRIGGGTAVAVVTDGVGDAMTGIPEANAYLAERWARPPALGALLNDLCFDARQHLDDRTAVVLWTPETL